MEDISRDPQVERELMLIKLNANPSTRAEVIMWYLVLAMYTNCSLHKIRVMYYFFDDYSNANKLSN